MTLLPSRSRPATRGLAFNRILVLIPSIDVHAMGCCPENSFTFAQDVIRREVTRCLQQAGPRRHILNVGHGVVQGTPEDSVGLFCELARESASIHRVRSWPAAPGMCKDFYH